MPSAQELAGPTGALILLVAVTIVLGRVVVALWKEHLKADQDDRDQRDRAEAALDRVVDGIRLNAEATAALARAWDERNKDDAARHRAGDYS